MRPASLQSRLSRCVLCGRGAPPSRAHGTRCELCGGTLLSIWGLGQLAATRGASRDAAGTGNPERRRRERSGDVIVRATGWSSP